MNFAVKSLKCLAQLALVGFSLHAAAQEPAAKAKVDAPLAQRGADILKNYCSRCHGVNFQVPDFSVLSRDSLVASKGDDQKPYVTPGKPELSQLWLRLGVDGDMPPAGTPQPTAEEKQLIHDWITAGAPFPSAEARPFKSAAATMADIAADLRKLAPADRPFQRYFTFAHLHNNPQIGDDDLRLARAALSKLVNSMSWKDFVVVPRTVDAQATVLGIDLRRVGWERPEIWREIAKAYPYGLRYDKSPEEELRSISVEALELSGDELPWVRGDWFVATASRPPLYHTIAQIPDTDGALQKLLNVDVEANFNRNRLARAGFATSGVSEQNRLVDRHHALYGHYWQSYDFKAKGDKGNLFKFPLGPEFKGNKFAEQAFEHDGGEIIFNLPNGLQGYQLIDGKGKRIDDGPLEVVSDVNKSSGTVTVVNGLSCMGCHKHGVIAVKDTVRAGVALSGDARIKVQQLFPKQETMDSLLKKDEDRFLKAMAKACGPFLQVGADAKKDIREFPEPISATARHYVKDLGPAEAAFELGLEGGDKLQVMVQGNSRLRDLGLGALKSGNTIKRDVWAALSKGSTLFQKASLELDIGTPFREL